MKPYSLAEAAAKACGKIVIWGGEGERQGGDDDNDVNDQQDDENSGESENSDGSGDQDDEDSDDEGDGKSGKPDSPNYEKLLRDAKKESIAQKKEIDRLKAAKTKADGDKDAAAERDEAQAENTKLNGLLNKEFLEWKIGKNEKYDWVVIDDVVNAIDKEAIDIDIETGEVDGLDLELKRISKSRPHWLKKNQRNDDDDEAPPASGSHPRGGKITNDEAELKRVGAKYKVPGYGSQALKMM